MAAESEIAKYRHHAEIRARGAIGNLAEGPVIRIHEVSTRLLAWPGNGFQTEAVHVLTLKPGEGTDLYTYGMAEEAMLGFQGAGQVFVRGRWVDLLPGDLAYFPEGVPHGVRNPASSSRDLVVVTQITPPQVDLYIDGGFYHKALGVMNFDALEKATMNAPRGTLSPLFEMAYRETCPEVRAWNLTPEEVRRDGALFNAFRGAEFSGIGVGPMRLVLWPGAGTRMAGFNFTYVAPHVPDVAHRHPVSDECLVLWAGRAQVLVADRWIDVEAHDVVLAPCGVIHGHRSPTPTFFGGFASPPQLDLLANTPYYARGVFLQPPSVPLDLADCDGFSPDAVSMAPDP